MGKWKTTGRFAMQETSSGDAESGEKQSGCGCAGSEMSSLGSGWAMVLRKGRGHAG